MSSTDEISIWTQLADEAELVAVALRSDGSIAYASRHFAALTEMAVSEAMPSSFFATFVPEGYRERANAHFLGESGQAPGASVRIPLMSADGRLLVIRWSRTVPIVLGGEALRLASGIDITTQIAGELDMATERARLAEAQRVAKIGSWELDHHDRTLSWSDEAYRIFETDPITTRPSYEFFLQCVHPDDRGGVDHAYMNSLATQKPYGIRHRLRLPDGRIRWVEERCETTFDPAGCPIVSRGTVQDITAAVEAEDAIKRNEMMVASFLRVSPEAVVVADRAGKVLTFSDGAEQMFRCRRDTMIGRQIDELMPDRFRAAHHHQLERFVASGERALRMSDRAEIRALRSTGEEFAAEATVSKILDGADQLFAIILRDLSERKAYEAALESARLRAVAATEAKSAFLATMSHEIRTPMNGVLGMLSILAMEDLTHGQREMVEVAIDAGHSLMEILNDILDYSRIESGQLRLEFTQFDLRSVLRKVCTLHGFRARETGLALEMCVDAGVPDLLMGDPARIQQIIHNLVGNAVKFTKAGRIGIHAACAEEEEAGRRMLEISVTDTGIGMTPEQLSIVFDRFTQADTTITRKFGGSGLGLAIVKGLADAMAGRITVRSQPGEGSCFTLKIPLIASAANATAHPDNQTRGARSLSGPVHVLVAEDNVLNATTLRLLLDRAGVVVSVAANGEEALKMFEPGRFDLILLDIQMPVLDGESALKVIRKLESSSGQRRAVAAAFALNADPDRTARYLQLGFDRVIPKPVDPEEVLDLLDRASLRKSGSGG